MRRKRRKKWMKRFHKWPSLIISLFIILWAISGVVLNHRHTFSPYDVNRRLLPEEHNYKNWNNASLRLSVRLDSARVLFYGNMGLWIYDEDDHTWSDFRKGLPAGADHHRINTVYLTGNGDLYCGTRFSLYQFQDKSSSWQAMKIPHHDTHVVDIAEINDSLWVLTRSHLWKIPLEGVFSITQAYIPAPVGYDNKVGLFKTLWVIHSGELYGLAGILIVDFVALVFVFLTVSGLIYFFFPRLMKHRKKKSKEIRKLVWWNKYSIKWHNRIGIWLVLILFITAGTGIFLRPPLLIAIANERVRKIPYSVLDDGNPWYDQLRRILHDKKNNRTYLATSEGIFLIGTGLKNAPELIIPQPPASVMGYNVFQFHSSGNILVGSFNGLFLWDPASGNIQNHISGRPHRASLERGIPLSEHMIAGYHVDRTGNEFIFDYNTGVRSIWSEGVFPAMPLTISSCRMPLWNVALELHTARLLKPLLGDLYIIFIPLFGLFTILILVSGSVLWIRKYRRKS